MYHHTWCTTVFLDTFLQYHTRCSTVFLQTSSVTPYMLQFSVLKYMYIVCKPYMLLYSILINFECNTLHVEIQCSCRRRMYTIHVALLCSYIRRMKDHTCYTSVFLKNTLTLYVYYIFCTTVFIE